MMANEAVLKYLQSTNRPYSCVDVTANLRGAHNKGAVQKALDALSDSGKIRCKLYGKQKVYVAKQTEDQSEDDTDLEDIDKKYESLTQQVQLQADSIKQLEATLKVLTSTPKTDDARQQLKDTLKRIDHMNKKLSDLQNTTQIVSAGDKKKILSEHERFAKEYRKRKRICTDMLDAILEGYSKSKKDLIEELCIETDESVNFKLNNL